MTERFARERVRYELERRELRVLRTRPVAPALQRITLGGEALTGFRASGPSDHIKVFFPDLAGGADLAARDYTPYAVRHDADGSELDIDFVLHGDNGPASAWAARAAVGDTVTIAGPRGSVLPPADVAAAVLVADESALPAAARWLDALGDVPVIGLFTAADADTVEYLAERSGAHRDFRWFTGDGRDERLAAEFRTLTIDDDTFFVLAGEASSLIPLRRYLRGESGLPKAQMDVQGYWKRGVIALDHHAPLDPNDPES